jgi:hypothetical protein
VTQLARLRPLGLLGVALFLTTGQANAADVAFGLPGFPETRMDAAGSLIEDWGTLKVSLDGATGPSSAGPERISLDGRVPAARARQAAPGVNATYTAFRGPAFPGGFDILTVRLEETAGKPATVGVSVQLPDGAQSGSRTATMGSRVVLSLPASGTVSRQRRDWGYDDEATSLPGWASPQGACDPAFTSIRAGLGGVPIRYRLPITPGGAAQVVLGLCESHWGSSGQRLMRCRVEGAPVQNIDPIARWGRHKPGALLFGASDVNQDGILDVAVLPDPASPDRNPILNALWVFPSDAALDLSQVIAGRLNSQATRFVDVGGPGDQSMYPGGTLQYKVSLPAKGVQELTFYAACPGGEVPLPTQTTWTPESLLRAASEVWRDWK